jgi:Ca2+-binding RTX toxin-like protein
VTGRTATVTVRLAPVNDAPIIAPFGPLAGIEDEFVAVQLPAGAFTDVDGDVLTLSVRLASGDPLPSWLVYNPVTRSLTGQPPENLNGAIDLVVTASDGQLQASRSFQLVLQPVNDAPVIAAIADVHTPEDMALSWQIPEGAISDVDGDALTVSVTRIGGAALPAWLSFDAGTLTLSGTPPENYFGRIALQLTASDGEISTTRAFAIVVDPVNDAPVLLAPFSDRFTPEDEVFDIRLQQGLFSDVDGDELTYAITALDGSPLPSWISVDNEALRLQGLPPLDYNGSIDVRVSASDGQITISDVFKLTVTPVNDAPVLSSPLPDVTRIDGQPLKTGASFTIAIPADTFTDPDGDALQFGARLASGEPLPVWMSFDGTKITGNPPHGAAGSYDVEILATDGQAQSSDVFRIVIEQGNSAPVANPDGTFTVYQPQPIRIAVETLLANDTDADGDALTVIAVSSSAGGLVSLADGFVTYNPQAGFAGPDQFLYLVSDGKTTSTGVVRLNVDASYAEYGQGTSGDDIVFGGVKPANIFGGDGDDTITAPRLGGSLAGGAGNDTLIGLTGSVSLEGNEGDDILIGGRGDDRLWGGTGNDILTGGKGHDTFVFRNGDESDVITDFDPGRRTRNMFIAGDTIEIDITGIDNFDQLMEKAQQTDGGVLFDFGNGDDLFLMGTLLAALDKDSFTFV